MRRLFTLIIVSLLSFNSLIAQDKSIEHTIVKGESVYAISKKYGVTVNAIFDLNPSSTGIIYPGEVLRIPDINNASTTQNNSGTNNSNLTDYRVKRGETKFGLSKKFGISIAMLEQQNPHIINMLQTGHIIKVDKTVTLKPKVSSNENEHVVLKGETLWGISQQYQVNLKNLTTLNSDQLSEFLQIGQTLAIPNNTNINQTLSEDQYLVKRGETKYSLAKRFNMTIAELEEKNPQIVPMLMAGHKLNVNNNTEVVAENDTEQPEVEIVEEKEELAEIIETSSERDLVETEIKEEEEEEEEEDTGFVDYIIQPNETLYSLSKKAGLTIEQLTTLNPKLLTAVNKGDTIKVPASSAQVLNDIKVTNTDALSNEDSPTTSNKSLIANLNLKQKNGVYFYLPFSDSEYNARKLRLKSPDKNEQKYYDFYQGALMAIDSAKALNLKFDITLIRKYNKINPNSKIIVDETNHENAVVIPFLEQDSRYPEIISNKKVPVIDIQSNIGTYPNTIVYNSIPSEHSQKLKTLNYLANKDANIILISDLKEARNLDLVLKTIPKTKSLKVDNAGFFNDDELDNALKKDKLNYVILDSEQTIVFLNTTTALMGRLSNYDIQLVLIDSKLIPKQNEVSNMRYQILNLIYPAIASKEDTKTLNNFESNYKRLYNTKPSMNAVIGFDVTLDLLLRLSQNSSFETTINTVLKSEHVQIKFDYQKINNFNYFNNGVYLMQYNATDGVVRIQ